MCFIGWIDVLSFKFNEFMEFNKFMEFNEFNRSRVRKHVGVTHKLIKLIKLIKLTLQSLSPSCRYWCELRKRP